MSTERVYGERLDRNSDISQYRRDTSTLHTWDPQSTGYNKAREVQSDIVTAWSDMNWELHEKYLLKYQGRSKGHTELRSLPKIFAECNKTISKDNDTLDDSANCLRQYFKRINARDDLHFLFQQGTLVKAIKDNNSSFV